MEEGLFPNGKVDYNDDDLEEERRLCFVGITRAKEKLYCFSAGQRKVYGMTKWHLPSRFLKEAGLLQDKIEENNLNNFTTNPYARFDDFVNNVGTKKSFLNSSDDEIAIDIDNELDGMLQKFRKGERIKHPNFGFGKILEMYGQGDKETAYIKFQNGQEKRLLLKYAKLEKC
jgi:DNA helicase-2/ATP-dependent DNA helicase PcrA